MMNHLLARTGLRVAARSMQRTQRRKMGDGPYTDKMHVKPNKFVEEWNGRREITEMAFEVNPSNLGAIAFCCVLFPYGIYHFTRKELMMKGDPRYKNSGLA
mmetsp:Transcript_28205/g.51389  ORF Transcript_28205/g.51389 Transcript_28205/m.51389 type:complete len:101 (+) Transcript_28205:92-394(+)|eukprot:CAMPEP_0201598702 /NCGR_PEP_ID=MMETSP0492-20130828/427_1 /ASSEMBLY_ACC=CAM_ASM_000837 /TAXON_ID=420259 /ORGANISM="Thalassiosira gravida, Strain GMp14c1" /LENGTH=100 /DNA_ID=CAMNT_0048061155 /DNA_START=98 /DNA_END=400 /DNA_ORIENTATION=-